MTRRHLHAIEYAYCPGNPANCQHIAVFRRSWRAGTAAVLYISKKRCPTAASTRRLLAALAAQRQAAQ